MCIDHLQAVSITIKRNAVVGSVRFYGFNQGLRVGGAAVLVDVQAIRRTAYGNDFSAQLMQHHRRNLVGRAMRRIYHDF